MKKSLPWVGKGLLRGASAEKLLGVFSVSRVTNSFAYFRSRVTNGISLLFHSVSFGFASFFDFGALGFSSIFFLAVARSERERNSSYGEEQYFFHGENFKEFLGFAP